MDNVNFMASLYECLHNPVVFFTYLYGTVIQSGPLKATTISSRLSICPSVRLSVRPRHGTSHIPLDEISWNFIFGVLIKIWREHLSLLKVEQKQRYFAWTSKHIYGYFGYWRHHIFCRYYRITIKAEDNKY
jgi:hypothetical protein